MVGLPAAGSRNFPVRGEKYMLSPWALTMTQAGA